MATSSCPLQPSSSLAEPRCGHAPCSIHSLFQPPSPADVTSDLQDHNQQERLLTKLQQQHQEREPTEESQVVSRGQLARSPLSSAACSSEEESSLEEDASSAWGDTTHGRSSSGSGMCHQRQAQPQQQPPPQQQPLEPRSSVFPQALTAAAIAASSSSAAGRQHQETFAAAGSSGSSGSSSNGGDSSVAGGSAVGESLRDEPLLELRRQATPAAAATASIGTSFRTSQQMLFGQPQGLFKGYPVMLRGRGSWRPLR